MTRYILSVNHLSALVEKVSLHYYVNINTLDIQVKYHQKGGFIGNILKIDNEPRYLGGWYPIFGLWIRRQLKK